MKFHILLIHQCTSSGDKNWLFNFFTGGDCKTLMFVQISPSSTDSGETLSSLNFATRVRAIEHGPARKQADPAETLKFKQMVFDYSITLNSYETI